jgi:hypothetical protein
MNRSKTDVAFDRLHAKANAENRIRTRIMRAKVDAPVDSAKAARAMDRELTEKAEKDRQRRLSSGFADFINGNDTPDSQEVRGVLAKVGAYKKKMVVAGDPSNITGHTPKPRISKDEGKRRAKEKTKRFVHFFDPTGKKVIVDLKLNPLAGIYRSGGISAPQFAAANQFQRDYDTSQYAAMRSRGFEPGVDGGKAASANLNAVAAQRVLSKLKAYLQEEPYSLMVAVIGLHIPFSQIHARGGDEVKVLSDRLRTALNKAATFYSFQAAEPESRTLRAIQDVWKSMVAQAGDYTT